MAEADPAKIEDGWVGQVIGDRYRIVDTLGEGAMGAVFVAEHLTLHKKVALKIIHAEHVDDEELRARFAREAMATARLDHPHVVSARDYGSLDDGSMYLVMDLVSGQTLRERLETGPALAWTDAAEIAAQIADALIAAHAEGIVHRDLKPDNVMLKPGRGGDRVKVLDFGIARVPTDAETATDGAAPGTPLTRLGRVMGTPGYMAPEQAMGDNVDARADIYALGVILWEMVEGRRLFSGAEFAEVIAQQLTTTPPRLENVPEELAAMVERMLVIEPRDRASEVAEIHDTLRRLVRRARRTPLANAEVDRASLPQRHSTPAALPLVLLGCAGLALVSLTSIVFGVALWPGGEEADPNPQTVAGPAPETSAPAPATSLPTGLSPESQPPRANVAEARDVDADPWDAPAPEPLGRIREELDRGRTPNGRVDRTLTGLAARHPDDPRPFLLLARVYLARRWRADAIREYRRAYERDPAARGDPQMLADLVNLVPHNTVGDDACRLIEDAYGATAVPAIEEALDAHRLDPDAAARYVLLRQALRGE